MARTEGVEPPPGGFGDRCSCPLSYVRWLREKESNLRTPVPETGVSISRNYPASWSGNWAHTASTPRTPRMIERRCPHPGTQKPGAAGVVTLAAPGWRSSLPVQGQLVIGNHAAMAGTTG